MRLAYDVYLSLAMHGRLGSDVLTQGENAIAICKKLGLTYYAPWSDENIRPNVIIDKKPNLKLMADYVRKDDKHVDQCRVLLILTGDIASSGTLWEASRMVYKNRRPIVAVAPCMCDGLLANFTTIKAAKLARSQKQALLWIKRRLK